MEKSIRIRQRDLDIKVTPFVEDAFYVLLALQEKISQEMGGKALDRILKKCPVIEYEKSINAARKMVSNLEKYGVACKEWE